MLELRTNFAWKMYVELLTRITTQPLDDEHGDEKTALTSIHSLFATTRDILKTDGRHCIEFPKISIIVLNQIVRPFTAKWHKYAVAGALTAVATKNVNKIPAKPFVKNWRHYTGRISQIYQTVGRYGRRGRFDDDGRG